MNHDVSLVLELLEQAADSMRFRLLVGNRSAVKLLLARPEIVGLRFGNKATRKESDWLTSMLVSATWAGFTIEPGDVKSLEYRVRPCAVELPETNDLDASDYRRWCVELPAGDYLVWFHMKQREDYFCCDSHYRIPTCCATPPWTRPWSGTGRPCRIDCIWCEPKEAIAARNRLCVSGLA